MKYYTLFYRYWNENKAHELISNFRIKADSLRQAINKLLKKYPHYKIENVAERGWYYTNIKRFRRKFFHKTERQRARAALKDEANYESYSYSEFLLRRNRSDLNFYKIKAYERMLYNYLW